jgi:hypothetical protein
MVQTNVQRRAVRRAVRTECQAVRLREFSLLGERVLDLSPMGMLVSCDRTTFPGDDVVVSFRAPGVDSPWFEAEAEVARVVRGHRVADRGYAAALRFTYFEKSSRNELLSRLAGHPPPIPQRRLRTARDRASSRVVRPIRPSVTASCWWDDPRRAQVIDEPLGAVVVRQILTLQDEPVFPLVRKRTSA